MRSMRAIEIETVETPSLGNATHLIATGDGGAVVIDPPRDAWRIEAAAVRRGWRITHVLETHVHNDYLSGAHELRASASAEIVAPAAGGYEFRFRGLSDGERLEVGALGLTARATPGHTPEHLAWEIADLDGAVTAAPSAVATGGSLLVGSAGRTDLLGPDRVDELTAAQHRSLRYLAGLPVGTRILPTHGTGSFCAAGPSTGGRTTTVGAEVAGNALLGIGDLETFRSTVLAGYGPYPDYYHHMAPLNRIGVAVLGRLPTVPRLDPTGVEAAVQDGARVVDGRRREVFARAHLPGSLHVEVEDDTFAAYVGWHVPFGAPVVLVLPDEPGIVDHAVTELLRIGYDRVHGVLDGGVDAWVESGRPTASFDVVEADAVAAATADPTRTVLDVRDPKEWRDDGTVDGTMRIPLWELAERLDELPADRPVTVLCASGRRASIAGSLLDAAGLDVAVLTRGGAPDILGRP